MASDTTRVLVVEDDVAQRTTLCDILQEEGFEPVGCPDGAAALERATREPFPVAVVDQRLPDLDGIQLLARLRQLISPLRGIIHTAYGSFESARDAVNAGAYAYIEKVGDPRQLILEVRHAMDEALAERLAQADEVLSSIFQFAPDAILQLERDGRIDFINHNLAGHALGEILGSSLLDRVVPEHRAALESALTSVFDTGEAEECEIAMDAAPGARHWYVCRLGPKVTNNVVTRAVLIAREVTRQKLRVTVDRIVAQLCRNARRAIGDDGTLSIRIGRVLVTDDFVKRNPEARVGPHMLVSVRDNGRGLTADELDRIFESFGTMPAEGPDGDAELVSVYAQVARAGGFIEVESEPDEGTTYHVHLPDVS